METTRPRRDTAAAPVHVLIPAAGRGVRFGSGDNKVFAPLAGRAVIARAAGAFLALRASTGGGDALCDSVTLIGRADELGRLREVCESDPGIAAAASRLRYCPGGATRQDSVALGLDDLARRGCPDDAVVLVHDGARPLVTAALIERCVDAVREHRSALVALPLRETVKLEAPDDIGDYPAGAAPRRVVGTRDRTGLWAAQTPQGASFELLREAHRLAARDGFAGTDEASLIERVPREPGPMLVAGTRENLKITTHDDLEFAARWLRQERMGSMVRVGMGYDIHRLTPGRRLVLGGVEIASEVGLLGHSDADALLHAICDALLGAAALPDIGHLFPDTDPAYAGIDSLELLREVGRRVVGEGYAVGNVDSCVIAERPRIAPHAALMRERIAGALGIDARRVSIKATTNEGLGALGAGEGIACHATATLGIAD